MVSCTQRYPVYAKYSAQVFDKQAEAKQLTPFFTAAARHFTVMRLSALMWMHLLLDSPNEEWPWHKCSCCPAPMF